MLKNLQMLLEFQKDIKILILLGTKSIANIASFMCMRVTVTWQQISKCKSRQFVHGEMFQLHKAVKIQKHIVGSRDSQIMTESSHKRNRKIRY